MQTQEIPSDQWGPFFDKITRSHQDEPVTIEIESRDLGSQPQAEGVRLIGITFDARDSTGQEIDVIVSNQSDAHLMHAIQHPARVRIARTDEGKDSAVQVESQDGPTTLLRFNMPQIQQEQQQQPKSRERQQKQRKSASNKGAQPR